ncbi:nitroreductase [Rhodococcoides trifolii]|uniref:Nitroreductase n=1 Tax=Rhodococcoides trifolii TaxID=908250 RepID=A0A917G5F0_9NOCA|nr:nitroreductase [Rhodococcus trifolii]GGG23548.1 nitroreductase [Rhodococcus trifolii]
MTLEALLNHRYSCRAYQDRQVDRADIEAMLRLAQRTPSWCNSQPWQVVVTSGETTTALAKALSEAAASGRMGSDIPGPEEYRGVYQDRRRGAGFALYDSVGIDRKDHARRAEHMAENFTFFGAPHTAIITTDKYLGTYGAVDCGGYVSTLVLAAQELGIATIPQAAIAMVSETVREFFGMPDDRLVVCAVSFGYADEDAPINSFRTDRAALDEAVTFA